MRFICNTLKPSAALRPYVDCYRYETFEGAYNHFSPNQYCLPHGTAELIFQFTNSSCVGWHGGQYYEFPESILVGITKETTVWKMKGGTEVFNVRLKPEGFIQLFNRPLADYFNNFIDLKDILGWKVNYLMDQLKKCKDNTARLSVIESFLQQQLHFDPFDNNYFLEALKRIRQADDTLSIEALSKSLHVGERQLQRIFKEKLGVSPKLYHRIIRFSHTYHAIQQKNHLNWADVALSHAYADQAHFIRDFKEFAGMTPGVMFG